MCRSGQIVSFPLNATITNKGIVVAFDFYPYTDGPDIQTIFSIRNTVTNYVSLRVDYFKSIRSLNVYIMPLTLEPYYVLNETEVSSLSITPSKIRLFYHCDLSLIIIR